MAQVAIKKCNDLTEIPRTLLEQMQAVEETIRQRAYDLFQSRNGDLRSDVDYWLRAERDVVWSPPAELVDEEKDYRVRLALPGLEAKEIQVSAMPGAVVIQADSAHTHEETKGNVRFCEFSDKKLFRRLELPGSIDVDKVSASLDKGILQVIAPKVAPKQIAVSA